MVKDSISLYTTDRTPLSLGNLYLHKGKFIEDIFDAVEDSADFTELDTVLRSVINQDMQIDRVTNRYIRYIVMDCTGNRNYLKIKIKRRV